MDSLFSHAHEQPSVPAPAPAVPSASRALELPLDPARVAEALVDYLHLWWPASSVLAPADAAGAHLWWDAEGLGAELEDGRELRVAETVTWDWPEHAEARLVSGPAAGSSLALTLEASDAGTLLTLTGDPQLVESLSHSFGRFMGISS